MVELWLIILGISAVLILIIDSAYRKKREKRRIALLIEKYGDHLVVERIMRGEIWKGQTQGQLIDSIGNPAKIDYEVIKTKEKNTFKYNPLGGNRFKTRVMIENGYVVGWKILAY